MPAISMFFGIIVYMRYNDNKEHKLPHIHVEYGEFEASFSLDGELLSGKFPPRQTKFVQAWIELRQNELKASWKLAIKGETLYRIEPLRG